MTQIGHIIPKAVKDKAYKVPAKAVPTKPAVQTQTVVDNTPEDAQSFVRKQFAVAAVKVTENNMQRVATWASGVITIDNDDPTRKLFIKVDVNRPLYDRQSKGYVGDWILRGETGGFRVYTDAAFHRAFDPAPNSEESGLDEFAPAETASPSSTSV